MDKFELKKQLIKISETLNNISGELMSKSANTEEVGIIRSEIISKMSTLDEIIREKIYNIY